ncbi:MAG: NAD(P)H-dependent oxidoreductase [Candidatus Omnitrophica bacterium]|nr:NAD(P)H-dependent oxidoreductase [Candidatus Omnitrophota bacterium]MBU4478591.1 NAD(P)H-dependent oxidoreductase [Candidatus Omnitrophota bacterium]
MRYLIIYAHPNPKSYNHAILNIIEDKLKKNGCDFEVRDLYKLKFNPVLSGEDLPSIQQRQVPSDIRIEQEHIKKADVLIFIHPIWWFGMPAVIKGYIDRVFSYGFAYAVDKNSVKGLLNGKKVMIFNTTGGPEENYKDMGYGAALKATIEKGIFEFCGMQVIRHKYFYAVPYISDEQRKAMLEDLRAMAL